MLAYDPATGTFSSVGEELGFDFHLVEDLTEDIECADMDGDGVADMVIVANIGQRDWLYQRR